MTEAPTVVPATAAEPPRIALRAHPASAALARRFIRETLAGHPYDPYDAALVACELVSNAIRHAAHDPDHERPIRLEIAVHDDHAHISVTDTDPRPIPHRPGRRSGDGGRGLTIIDAHSTSRTVIYGTEGKTVTVCLPALADRT